MFGGLGNGYNNNFDYTNTGLFSPSTAKFGASSVLNANASAPFSLYRLAAIAGYLGNGNLLFGTGKIFPNGVRTNDIWVSQDLGNTWIPSALNPAFQPRSDASYATLPGTGQGTIVMAGGTVGGGNNGYAVGEVWVSKDGVGATWTQATNATSFGFTDSAMVFLYDTPNTLVLYAGLNIYTSNDTGMTWSAGAYLGQWTNGVTPPGYGNVMVADSSNNLYLTGTTQQNNGQSNLYWSGNKGATWSMLPQIFASKSATTLLTLNNIEFACMGVIYSKSTVNSAPYLQTNLVIYGGTDIQADANSIVLNGTNWCPATVATAYSNFGAITANIVPPGFSNNDPDTTQVPTSAGGGQPLIAFHDSSSPAALGTAGYSTCAYDVHALLNSSNQTPRMWQLGGFTNTFSFINTVAYTATGNWSQGQTFTVTSPTGRVAGAAGVLANGAFLYFGGKATGASTGIGSNDVWSSTNNGQTFSQVTAAAAWTARADLAAAFLPGTNIVMIAGGANTAGAGTLNDTWVCQDGVGAVWTQATPLPTAAFSDAGFVALYDAPGTATATVVLAFGTTIYTTNNLGQTWILVAPTPWPSRYANTLTADAESYLYAAGGQHDGNIYFSWNKAVSWAVLQQSAFTSVWPAAVDYLFSQYNCQAIRYIPTTSAASPALAHKQLIIYGGDGAQGIAASALTTVPLGQCNTTQATVVYGEILFPASVTCLQGGSCASTQPPVTSSSGAAPAGSSAAARSAGSSPSAATSAPAGSAVASSAAAATSVVARTSVVAGVSSSAVVTSAAAPTSAAVVTSAPAPTSAAAAGTSPVVRTGVSAATSATVVSATSAGTPQPAGSGAMAAASAMSLVGLVALVALVCMASSL